MHELAVTQSILELVLKHAQAAHAARVTDIHIVVGELSANADDSVQFYWDMIVKGTPAEGAQLHFDHVPAQLQCTACSTTFHPAHLPICPACGSSQVRVIAGQEFHLASIDIENR